MAPLALAPRGTDRLGSIRKDERTLGPYALPCSLSGLRLSSLFFNVRYTPSRELLHNGGLKEINSFLTLYKYYNITCGSKQELFCLICQYGRYTSFLGVLGVDN